MSIKMKEPTIPEFFSGRDIFITGGSGFMGKVLIEKLLRSCSDLHNIFVLLRSKKGKNADERLKTILGLHLFDTIRNDNPELLQKVIAINGDVTLDELGIAVEDFEMIRNVSVIFHSAASVRFDDPLKDAIRMNTNGTLQIMQLAEKLPKIVSVLHVSTTYCNPDQHTVDEKLYPPYADWKYAIKISEYCSTEELNVLQEKYSNFQPNTYTFTKSLSEQIINDYKDKLPVVIYRPSIVISSVAEPVSGWLDNFNGPVGIFIASGMGILRTMHGDPDVVSDYIPVDISIKAMIVAAYKKGIETVSSDELTIYNCSTSSMRAVPYKDVIGLAHSLIRKHPFERSIWISSGGPTKCRYYNYFRLILSQVLVAIFLDGILRFTKNKPMFVKLQRKIYAANLALHYFATTNWTFNNTKFITLDKTLLLEDRESFAFLHYKDFDLSLFFTNALFGVKKYLLNEPTESTRSARIKLKIMIIVDTSVKILFWGLIIKWLNSYLKILC